MPDDSNYTQLQIENLIEENNIDEDLEEYFGDDDQELEAYSLECVYGADDYNAVSYTHLTLPTTGSV